MKNINFIFILVLSINVYCQGEQFNNTLIKGDTIKPTVEINTKCDSCFKVINNYYKLFGIFISEYYNVMDSIKIDLNNDKIDDYLIILSPLSLNIPDKWYQFRVDSIPKRLLVEIIIEKGKSKIRNIYSDIISNEGVFSMSYNSIIKTKKGFDLNFNKGNHYRFEYKLSFLIKENYISIFKIKKICYIGNYKKMSIYEYNNYPIEKINIIDTLNNDCNCEEDWNFLHQKYNL